MSKTMINLDTSFRSERHARSILARSAYKFQRSQRSSVLELWDTERSNCCRPYGLTYQDLRVLCYRSTRHWPAWDIVIVTYPEDQIHAIDVTGYFTLAPPTEVVPGVQQYPLWDLDSMKSTAVSSEETSRADSGNTR
jgi:hypothetical protein